MHHPGPPRFVATGHEVELAPRDPDPDATYSWQLAKTPDGSSVAVGDDPVEQLVPDVPGTYVARLSAPDGEHELTIRAFSGDLAPHGEGRVSGSGGWSGQVSGSGSIPGVSGPGVSGSGSGAGAGTQTADGEGGRPRLTLSGRVEDDVAIVSADPAAHPDGTETDDDLDVEFLLDDRDDVDLSAVLTGDRELRIPVEVLDDRTRVHAVSIGEHGYSVPDMVEFTLTDDTVDVSQPYHPPAWGEEATIYEIYVRTFGDSEGESAFDVIADRLDYIESLGVDTIWLTPVLQNDHAPHGYNIIDFFSIAEDLGSREDYERFIDAAHERGLSVLFDLVCNHSARTHPHFQAAVSEPDSEYRDWYEWREGNDPETYFEGEHIANFNFEHLPVRRHLLDAVDKWSPLVDGFRCDMAWAVPNNFWRELHDRLKDRDPEFLLLDETIPYIPDFQAGLFDMHFDSTTYFTLRQIGLGQDADTLLDAIDNRAEIGFPDHAGFMLYSENHDETRYIVDCGRDAAKAALGAVFTLPGAPMVYAGQEFGQRGKRDDLAWEHADEQLQDHTRALSAARTDLDALSTAADLEAVSYTVTAGSDDRVVAYARSVDEQTVVVVLNFGEESATVDVPAVTDTTDLVSGDDLAADGGVTVDSVGIYPAAIDN